MSDEKKTEWSDVRECLDMTCRHDDDASAEADGNMASLMVRLAELGYGEAARKDFLSVIVTSLEHDLDGWWIDFVACDQWFGAGIKRYSSLNVHEPGNWLVTQGDTAEDCLAQLWLRAAEITPPTTGSVPSPAESGGSHNGSTAGPQEP